MTLLLGISLLQGLIVFVLLPFATCQYPQQPQMQMPPGQQQQHHQGQGGPGQLGEVHGHQGQNQNLPPPLPYYPPQFQNPFGDDKPFGPEINSDLSPEMQERVLERVNELVPDIVDAVVKREMIIEGLIGDDTKVLSFNKAMALNKAPGMNIILCLVLITLFAVRGNLF